MKHYVFPILWTGGMCAMTGYLVGAGELQSKGISILYGMYLLAGLLMASAVRMSRT